MSGRHRSDDGAPTGAPATGGRRAPRGRRRHGGLIALLVVLAVVAASLTYVFGRGSSGGRGDQAAAADCAHTTTVPVVAAPVIAPALKKIVDKWQGTRPRLAGGVCVQVNLASVQSASEEKLLVSATTPTVWIPESTAWSARLALDAPARAAQLHSGGSIASSPLVVVTAPGRAAAARAIAADGWAAAVTGIHPLVLPDPMTTPEGALTVLDLGRLAAGDPDPQTTLTGQLLPLAATTLADTVAGFSALRKSPLNAPAFIASEQAVIAAGAGAATAVPPAGDSPALDFPAITVGAASDPSFQRAAALLVKHLKVTTSVTALNAAGLRDPQGTPLMGSSGVGTNEVRLVSPPATAAVGGMLKAWKLAQKPGALLAVIDVSGSMKDPSGNGQSKIDVVSKAAANADAAIPANWRVGLWTFAQHSTTKDWTERIAPARVGTGTNRAALIAAAKALPDEVGGNTGLYETALAAYQAATAAYDPSAVNSVVLMTDGANVDPGGIGLTALITALTKAYDPARPVQIITIAFGADADVSALRQISAATHSYNYVVLDANDIQSVLLESVLRRS